VSLGERLRTWRPEPPALPDDLARLVGPDDPDPTRPTTAVAAYPGGVVPEDIT
jgi:1-acyl-sn-glycerol-3-phosphate acyltransferase